MREYCGIVETISGAKTLCVSIKIGTSFHPRYILLNNVLPIDAMACQQWLESNVKGKSVYFYAINTNRLGQYISDVECDGFDIGQELIKLGFAE
jgi:hypothetical protein